MGKCKGRDCGLPRGGVHEVVTSTGEQIVASAARRLAAGRPLSAAEAGRYLSAVLDMPDGGMRDAQLGVLLSAFSAQCEEAEVVAELVRAALDYSGWRPATRPEGGDAIKPLLGVAGSGKKEIKTANISTAACFAAAAAGASIVKNVSAAASSVAGSADTLDELGVHVCETTECAREHARASGLAFLRIESQLRRFDEVYGGKFLAPHVLSLALPAAILPVDVTSIAYGLSHPNVRTSARSIALLRPDVRVSVFASHDPSGGSWIDEAVGEEVRLAQDAQHGETFWHTSSERSMRLSSLGGLDVLGMSEDVPRAAQLERVLSGTASAAITQAVSDTAVVFLLAANETATVSDARSRVENAISSGAAASLLVELRERRAAA